MSEEILTEKNIVNEAEAAAEAPSTEQTGEAAVLSDSAISMEAFEEGGEEVDLSALEEKEGEEAGASVVAEPIEYKDLSSEELQATIEAVLFMHHKPVSLSKLQELINPNIDLEEYRTAVSNLMASYFETSRGIELVEVANCFQFRTKSEHKDIIRRMYQIAPMKLTNAMLEVLAIVAYNQPITREFVDKIRGVDSSHLLRVLMDKKMLRIAGKSDDLGRPMLYATTKEFLELFGLRDLTSLPSLREIEDMLPKNEVGAEISEEEALAKEMEGIVDASKPLEFNDLELESFDDEHGQERIAKPKTEAPQGAEGAPALSAREDGDGRPALDSAEASDGQTAGDLDLPAEAAGSEAPGPEGESSL